MRLSEFINYCSDKEVTLLGSEIMKCENWFDHSIVLRDALNPFYFHYYHYNCVEGKLIHLKYHVE